MRSFPRSPKPRRQSRESKVYRRQPAVPTASAYVDGLVMLGRRELSEMQVRQRLVRKGHSVEDVDEAITRLKAERALDDSRVAKAIARTDTSIKRRGKSRIKQDMSRAGIASSTAREAIDEIFSEIDDDALIDAALGKRLRHGRLIADDREFARLYRYLMTQGFESDQALKLLRARRQPT